MVITLKDTEDGRTLAQLLIGNSKISFKKVKAEIERLREAWSEEENPTDLLEYLLENLPADFKVSQIKSQAKEIWV